jgi:hypothetical protein
MGLFHLKALGVEPMKICELLSMFKNYILKF